MAASCGAKRARRFFILKSTQNDTVMSRSEYEPLWLVVLPPLIVFSRESEIVGEGVENAWRKAQIVGWDGVLGGGGVDGGIIVCRERAATMTEDVKMDFWVRKQS